MSTAARPSVELTNKEVAIFKRICEGKTYRQIADMMNLSPRTVEWHVNNALRKTRCHNRIEAVQVARKIGALPYPRPSEDEVRKFQEARLSNLAAVVTGICVVVVFMLFEIFVRRP